MAAYNPPGPTISGKAMQPHGRFCWLQASVMPVTKETLEKAPGVTPWGLDGLLEIRHSGLLMCNPLVGLVGVLFVYSFFQLGPHFKKRQLFGTYFYGLSCLGIACGIAFVGFDFKSA